MSNIRIIVQAGAEQVTARLTGWHGEPLDVSHVQRIHDTLDRALTALRIPASEPARLYATD